jgi:hypothetical protein
VSFNLREGSVSTGQKISIGLGIVYFAVGILGFVPALVAPSMQSGQGLLLGIFAVNTIHNVVHLIAGVGLIWAGLAAERVVVVGKALAIVLGSVKNQLPVLAGASWTVGRATVSMTESTASRTGASHELDRRPGLPVSAVPGRGVAP